MNREGKRDYDVPIDKSKKDSVILESQFILRMPEEPAKVLREVLQSGANLKDRLTILLENDMRYGEVRLDHWLMHAKVVDMPTIIESLKTIDNKSFYKTADICQMMICKEEPDQPSVEEELPSKNKKKDPYKVDKKFLWPHGITPPTKNVRKRRFRKTLKKKYVEAPEIEKEVKRLLRVDNDAFSVSWDIITEEEEHSVKVEASNVVNVKSEKPVKVKQESAGKSTVEVEVDVCDASQVDVERDIFGDAVSDSDLDNEDENINVELEDASRLSAYDSRMSDSTSLHGNQLLDMDIKGSKLPTQFRSDMFSSTLSKYEPGSMPMASASRSESDMLAGPAFLKGPSSMSSPDHGSDYQSQGLTRGEIALRMDQLNMEIDSLQNRKQRTQHEISGMENLALRQRFQDILQTIQQDILYKEMKYNELQTLLQQADD